MEDSIKAKLSGILSNFGGKTSAVSNLLSSEEGKKLGEFIAEHKKTRKFFVRQRKKSNYGKIYEYGRKRGKRKAQKY